MNTSRSRSTSRRRFICTTLLWSLALLTLTNVAWGLWAAFRFDDPDNSNPGGALVAESGLPTNRTLVLLGDASVTRTRMSIWVEDPDPGSGEATSSWTPHTFNEVLPGWLVPYCAPDGRLVRAEKFDWCGVEAVGWPLRILWIGAYSTDSVVRRLPISGVQVLKSQGRGYKSGLDGALPLRPIWSGQAFYAVFWFGVVCVTRFGRRGMRAWRGCCTRCAYNLRGNTSGVCPECGASVNGERA